MNKPDFSALRERSRELGLSQQANLLAETSLPADELLDWLRGAGLHADAIRLLPHLLPKRRALWWACLCVWDAHGDTLSPPAAAAIEATMNFIQQPTESHRRACEAAANAASLQTSAGCVAMGAFWSEGSMSLQHLPVVAPPESLTAKVVAGAVLLAAAEQQPHLLREHYWQFLELGQAVARGELLWHKPAAEERSRRWHLHDASTVPAPHTRHSTVVAAAPWFPSQYGHAENQS